MAKLLLLDGHSLAYRAYYALPADMATKSGTFTNAVFGFTSMLAKVLADEQPDYLAVAFDTKQPTFRNELDAEYKAGRKATPELFSAQLPLIREVLDTLAVPVLTKEGVEADDVIGTLAVRAAAVGMDVIVVTGDRDSYQLVSDPHVKVLYNKRGVSDYALYDEAGIFERTGVTPAQYPDYAALRGDNSDNLPGVPGIGEKTAAALIQSYGNLEGIFEHIEELKPKQRVTLPEWRDRVFLNRQMSRLVLDVELDYEPSELQIGGFDPEAVRELFIQLEFRTLYDRLMEGLSHVAGIETPVEVQTFDVEVTPVHDVSAAAKVFDGLAATGAPYALDARWVGVAGRSAVEGLGVAAVDGAWYVPGDLLQVDAVRAALDALTAPHGAPLIAHQAKWLMRGLALDLQSLDLDTAVGAYLLDPGEGKYDLGDLALRHLGIEITSPDKEVGTLDFDGSAGVDEAGRRAAAVLALAEPIREGLEARDLTSLYETVERPLVRVLALMERAGVLIDRPFLDDLRHDLQTKCDQYQREVFTHAGHEFNVNSTPQLRTVLFDELGMTPVKRTKTGPSTDADSLQKMANDHPILQALLRYREVEKLRNTYADALPPLIESDGRIHATFKQTATTTGRISSDTPNLQNIPVRSAEGLEMRKAFVAPAGHQLLSADYSQIELRVLAHLAEDPGLIDAFERNVDIHTVTAAAVYGVTEDAVTSEQRRFAKVVNYGLAYGMEAYGLSQRAGIEVKEAAHILDRYFAGFPKVREYMDHVVVEASDRGYTTTILGRRRQIPELASANFRIRQQGERMAQNAPVQGSAADVFKIAMVNMQARLDADDVSTRMTMTVHDELVFEVPDHEVAMMRELVPEVMGAVVELRVPLVVDVGVGPTWAAAK